MQWMTRRYYRSRSFSDNQFQEYIELLGKNGKLLARHTEICRSGLSLTVKKLQGSVESSVEQVEQSKAFLPHTILTREVASGPLSPVCQKEIKTHEKKFNSLSLGVYRKAKSGNCEEETNSSVQIESEELSEEMSIKNTEEPILSHK